MAKVQNMAIYGQQNNTSYALLDVKVTNGEATSVVATKDGKTIELSKNNILPNGYTQLEYIGLNGNQYITLNAVAITSFGFYVKYLVTSVADWGPYILGCPGRYWERNTADFRGKWVSNSNGEQKISSSITLNTLTWVSCNVKNDLKIDASFLSSPTFLANTGASFSTAIILGAYHNDVTESSLRMSGRFYEVKIYNAGNIVYNLIPAKRNSDSVLGMYDIINNVFYTNAGTGSFIAGPELGWVAPITSYGTWTVTATDGTNTKTENITINSINTYTVSFNFDPLANYTKVEYIECPAAFESVDVGYHPVSSCNFSGKFRVTEHTSTSDWQYWHRPFICDGNGRMGIESQNSQGMWMWFNSTDSGTAVHFSSIQTNIDYTFSSSGRSLTLNGTTVNNTIASAITSPLSGTVAICNRCRMYWMKITESDGTTLARDLIPVTRKSDSRPGFWDKVNQVFYPAPTDFIVGPVVS